jgi:hypothetical protein
MHNHVARVIKTQSPWVLPSPIRIRRQRLEMLGQCQHLAGRTAGRNHLIGDRRRAGEPM